MCCVFLGPVIPVCAARQGTQEYVVMWLIDIEAGTFGGTVSEDVLYESGAFGGAMCMCMCMCMYVYVRVSGGVREDESRAGSIGLMV